MNGKWDARDTLQLALMCVLGTILYVLLDAAWQETLTEAAKYWKG